VLRSGPGPQDPPAKPATIPIPPLSSSPFLNTKPEARFVGSEACRSCHQGRTASFRRSGMGRSMAAVDLAREPPDASFDHPLSKRRYQVRRKDGQLWHRELLLTDGKGEVLLSEYPLRYVVGSGHHSLTYLVEADGFLVESPVTWYTSRKAWGMSPGYDRPEHFGFERPVGEGCLICHAGQARAVGGGVHRMHIDEAAIGCERCHGPGSLHVERHAGRKGPVAESAEVDYTIVNPTRLSRDLAEAICQQCHLRASATVILRGRKPEDFRPGLPRQDFHADYYLAVPDRPMTVVGHVEQMHLSRCYKATDTLSCLTCHNPHGEPRPAERVEYYKKICTDCHRPERCTVAPQLRQKQSPDNNCVHCHMPTSSTEIPHLAFTHHRIGIHGKPAAAGGEPLREGEQPGVLEPFLDLSRLSAADRKRALGLAYLDVLNQARTDGLRRYYAGEALNNLSAARALGLRDSLLDLSLGRSRYMLGLEGFEEFVQSGLKDPDLADQDRCDALYLLASAKFAQREYREAVDVLHRLNKLRRFASQWVLLASCERALGHPAAEEDALQTAVRINPRLWQVQRELAARYRQKGDQKRAAWHQARAVP
jgi:predicted CXXCH cytochrome family protein